MTGTGWKTEVRGHINTARAHLAAAEAILNFGGDPTSALAEIGHARRESYAASREIQRGVMGAR